MSHNELIKKLGDIKKKCLFMEMPKLDDNYIYEILKNYNNNFINFFKKILKKLFKKEEHLINNKNKMKQETKDFEILKNSKNFFFNFCIFFSESYYAF